MKGQHSWFRNRLKLARNGKILSAYAERYSVPGAAGQQQHLPDITPTSAESNAEPANYSLHIKSVALRDESNEFYCHVGAFDHNHRSIQSRFARLTVLQPPTRLLISATTDEQAANEKSATTGQVTESAGRFFDDREGRSSNSVVAAAASGSLQVITNIDNNFKPFPSSGADLSSEPVKVAAKHRTRLRLECRSDLAKPRAQLTWYDHQYRPVDRREMQPSEATGGGELQSVNSSYLTSGAAQQWEELSADSREPKLVASSAIITLTVGLEHANQIFTCQAKHQAFEQQASIPELYNRELKRQVLLDVLYEPRISLVKDTSLVYENSSLRLQCLADGNPARFTYRWFIDNQPILADGTNSTESEAGSGEPELVIERVTRQLHLREIKCEVSNLAGTSSSIIRLPVRYAPSYATHLIPSASFAQPAQQSRSSTDEQALARQLAIAANRDQDVTLHCDFDSYPQVKQVQWFKVPNNYYNIMHDVTPLEASEYIGYGSARAIFREQTLLETGELIADSYADDLDSASSMEATTSHRELDYDLMSRELLAELASGSSSSSKETSSTFVQNLSPVVNQPSLDQQQFFNTPSFPEIYSISNQTPSFSTLPIREPLQFELLSSSSSSSSHEESLSAQDLSTPLNEQQARQQPNVAPNTIRLIQPTRLGALKLPGPLQRRDASLSSSTLQLSKVNEESVGRYICKAIPADSHSSEFARSIYLVLKEPPRIVSIAEQTAPLAAQRIQIECLAQINANQDAYIRWTKDDKPILSKTDPAFKSGLHSRIYVWKEKKSPDLLFLRSIVRIDEPQLEDFGHYFCNVFAPNMNRNDTLKITLKQTALTGFIFNMMAVLTVGSILLLVCLISSLIICSPRRKLESKEHHMVVTNGKTINGSLDQKSPQSDLKQPHFSTATNDKDEQQVPINKQDERDSSPVKLEEQQRFTPIKVENQFSAMRQGEMQQQQQQQQKPVGEQQNSIIVNQEVQSAPSSYFDPYFMAISKQQQPPPPPPPPPQPHYSTVYSTRPFPIQTSMNCNPTIPLGSVNVHHCSQMVPTSDIGDTYFETNYGTLISRSSAYKTLGYASINLPQTYTNNGYHSTASSSPNSLATQANSSSSSSSSSSASSGCVNSSNMKSTIAKSNINNNNTNYADLNTMNIQNLHQSKELHYGDNHITMVKADGSTTTFAKNLTDNGLVTYV